MGFVTSKPFDWALNPEYLLLVFAAVYGFLAPSWSALWTKFASTVGGDDPHLSSMLMCIFIAGRGVGNALAAPISSGLLHPWALTGKSEYPYALKGYVSC